MKLSIITATYNCAATVADCMASVRRQTHPDVEQIIIDGASTDDTLDVLRSPFSVQGSEDCGSNDQSPVPGPRSPVVISEPDRGIYDAMNKGIALATGEVIGILNADDWYADPEVLARVAAVFEDPAVMSCYGDLVYVKNEVQGSRFKVQGSPLHPSRFTVVRYWKAGEFAPRKFYWGWMPPHPTFFVRRCVYERCGGFRLDMGSAADYELMLRFLLGEGVSAAYIPRLQVAMRVGGASNASLKGRLRANRMDRRAWEVNGLSPFPWTIPLKPLRKLSQWFVKGGS